MNRELIIRSLLIAFLVTLIVITMQAIIKGAKEGVTMGMNLLHGVPIEEVYKKEKDREEKRREKDHARFQSTWYKLFHPLGYLNLLAEEKLKSIIEVRGKKDGR